MSDRDRFNCQMHYRPIDRSFNMEFGYWNENFDSWDIFVENGIRNNEEADAFFSFDSIATVAPPIWMNPPFAERVVRETETTRIVTTSEGLLAEIPKDGHDTIPHYLGSSIVTPDDWLRCKEERFRRDDPARKVNVDVLKARHPVDRDYPLGVHCGSMIGQVRNLLTLEGLSFAVYDHREMVEDMVETCCVLIEDFLDQVLHHIDFDYASGWEDISSKSGPLAPRWFFRDVVSPRYERIGKKLRGAGIDLWYTDCDGDVRPLLPIFLQSGINCLFPYEVNSCVHPGTLLAEYGRELRIMGGVDKLVLARGPEAIRRYLESLVPLVERGGYIPFCDHRCPPDVRPEYYLAYLDLKEQLFGCGSSLFPESTSAPVPRTARSDSSRE